MKYTAKISEALTEAHLGLPAEAQAFYKKIKVRQAIEKLNRKKLSAKGEKKWTY